MNLNEASNVGEGVFRLGEINCLSTGEDLLVQTSNIPLIEIFWDKKGKPQTRLREEFLRFLQNVPSDAILQWFVRLTRPPVNRGFFVLWCSRKTKKPQKPILDSTVQKLTEYRNPYSDCWFRDHTRDFGNSTKKTSAGYFLGWNTLQIHCAAWIKF